MSFSEPLLKYVCRRKSMALRYIHPIPVTSAQPDVAAIYGQVEKDLLLNPTITLHSPVLDILRVAWAINRETYLVSDVVERAKKEALAIAVSKSNSCQYCTDIHETFLASNFRNDFSRGSEQRFNTLEQWAGATRYKGAKELVDPPFSRREVPEIIGTVIFYHYINRLINVFGEKQGFSMPGISGGVRNWIRKHLEPFLAPVVRKNLVPGVSLITLHEYSLPADLEWCRVNKYISKAFSAFDSIIEEQAALHIPKPVQELVRYQVSVWDGADPGLSRIWLQNMTANLLDQQKASAQLALLVAFASYRVGPGEISRFRIYQPEDKSLLIITSWVSFLVARRIGSWIPMPKD